MQKYAFVMQKYAFVMQKFALALKNLRAESEIKFLKLD